MKFNFTVTSNSLKVTLDTQNGFLEPNIKEYFEPNLILGNNRIYLKEESQFIQDFPFKKIGLIGTKTPLNLIDAYELLESLIKSVFSSSSSATPSLQQVVDVSEYVRIDNNSSGFDFFDVLDTDPFQRNGLWYIGDNISKRTSIELNLTTCIVQVFDGLGIKINFTLSNGDGSFNKKDNTSSTKEFNLFFSPNILTKKSEWVFPETLNTTIENVASREWVNVKYIPLSGTTNGNPVVGLIELSRGDGALYSNDSLYENRLDADVGGWQLFGLDKTSGFSSSLLTNPVNFQIQSDNPLFSGIFGTANYSANYTPFSFVQKAYVDNKFAPVNNNTTTNLSLTQLNTQYPSADIGYKVHCMNIAGVKLIYEKTSTGWCSYAVNIVS
jgi:hypothetical protein